MLKILIHYFFDHFFPFQESFNGNIGFVNIQESICPSVYLNCSRMHRILFLASALQYIISVHLSARLFYYCRPIICSLTRLSLTHRKRNVQLFWPYLRCLWIDLDVLYGFATQNFMKMPFLMVAGVNMPGIGEKFSK